MDEIQSWLAAPRCGADRKVEAFARATFGEPVQSFLHDAIARGQGPFWYIPNDYNHYLGRFLNDGEQIRIRRS